MVCALDPLQGQAGVASTTLPPERRRAVAPELLLLELALQPAQARAATASAATSGIPPFLHMVYPFPFIKLLGLPRCAASPLPGSRASTRAPPGCDRDGGGRRKRADWTSAPPAGRAQVSVPEHGPTCAPWGGTARILTAPSPRLAYRRRSAMQRIGEIITALTHQYKWIRYCLRIHYPR